MTIQGNLIQSHSIYIVGNRVLMDTTARCANSGVEVTMCAGTSWPVRFVQKERSDFILNDPLSRIKGYHDLVHVSYKYQHPVAVSNKLLCLGILLPEDGYLFIVQIPALSGLAEAWRLYSADVPDTVCDRPMVARGCLAIEVAAICCSTLAQAFVNPYLL